VARPAQLHDQLSAVQWVVVLAEFHCMYISKQWRTQKTFMGSFIQWHVVVICIWCALFVTSYSCFQTNVLAKFIDIICIFAYSSTRTSLTYKVSALQVRISDEKKLNATAQQFITAEISGCALKQGNKTHSSLRQNNLPLQSEAALMSCRIRAVEHKKYVAGLYDVHPVCKIQSKLHKN